MTLYCPQCRSKHKDNETNCPRCTSGLVQIEKVPPFCKSCGKTYSFEDTFCPDCLVELSWLYTAPDKSGQGDNEHLEFVTIYETSDLSEVALIKGALETSGIRFNASGEGVQSFLGLGLVGGFNPLTGPVKIEVEKGRAEEAEEIIKPFITQ